MSTNAVIYLRVSTQRQGQSGLGLEAQREVARRFALAKGMTVRAEYTDVQSGKDDNRPGLCSALALCRKNRGTLVVAELSRLSRHAAFTMTVLDSGVPIAAADMPEADRTLLSIMAVIYEKERLDISKRTRSALAAYKARGGKLGNPNGCLAFGDKRGAGAAEGTIRAADDFAKLNIQAVREMWKSGMSLRAIANTLNQEGIETRRGGQWYATTVKNLLERNI